MAVKPIFGTYPYLKISKEYGVPYADVLMMAEAVRDHGTDLPFGIEIRGEHVLSLFQRVFQNMPDENHRKGFASMLEMAVNNFKRIQAEGWDQSNG